jgi:hypothetical protein
MRTDLQAMARIRCLSHHNFWFIYQIMAGLGFLCRVSIPTSFGLIGQTFRAGMHALGDDEAETMSVYPGSPASIERVDS